MWITIVVFDVGFSQIISSFRLLRVSLILNSKRLDPYLHWSRSGGGCRLSALTSASSNKKNEIESIGSFNHKNSKICFAPYNDIDGMFQEEHIFILPYQCQWRPILFTMECVRISVKSAPQWIKKRVQMIVDGLNFQLK